MDPLPDRMVFARSRNGNEKLALTIWSYNFSLNAFPNTLQTDTTCPNTRIVLLGFPFGIKRFPLVSDLRPLQNSPKTNSIHSENRLAPISVRGLEMGNRRVGYFVAHAGSHPTNSSFAEVLIYDVVAAIRERSVSERKVPQIPLLAFGATDRFSGPLFRQKIRILYGSISINL